MNNLKQKFEKNASELGAEIKAMLKEHGDKKIQETSLKQIYGGMRGMIGLVCETSLLDAEEGIHFKGYSIPQLVEKLPKAEGGSQPLPEGLFYLMLIGELPADADAEQISAAWGRRSHVPNHVFEAINKLPLHTHPMTMLSIGIMAMQTESVFAKAYKDGISKSEYWSYTFEDCLNLTARLPRIAAYIYRRKYKNDEHIHPDGMLDWAANFAHMLGYDDPEFHELMRLYLCIHADHEGGNISAHTSHVVSSALSDPYLSFAAGMNGLAGPLHGLANQEVIRWIKEMISELNTTEPSKEQIAKYVQETLDAGKVIPGYGHAVLRKTDPRFTAQMEFAKQYCADDSTIQTVWNIYDVVPDILGKLGKVKNPWPNVDSHSGALLQHYGLVEEEFYTVLFGVSRALGILAGMCWDRALGMPLERPKSVSTRMVKQWLNGDIDSL
jgi:citrate synthase